MSYDISFLSKKFYSGDQIILHNQDSKKQIYSLFNEISKDSNLIYEILEDPVQLLKKHNIIHGAQSTLKVNSIFFMLLSNYNIKEWWKKYKQEFIDNHNNNTNFPTKEKVYNDILKALNEGSLSLGFKINYEQKKDHLSVSSISILIGLLVILIIDSLLSEILNSADTHRYNRRDVLDILDSIVTNPDSNNKVF